MNEKFQQDDPSFAADLSSMLYQRTRELRAHARTQDALALEALQKRNGELEAILEQSRISVPPPSTSQAPASSERKNLKRKQDDNGDGNGLRAPAAKKAKGGASKKQAPGSGKD